MADILLVLVCAALTNNVVLMQSLGVSTTLATSDSLLRATATSVMTMIVTTLAAVLLWPLQHLLLQPFDLTYLRLPFHLLVIAVLAVGGELLLRIYRPLWQRSLAALLPLVTVNSAVLGTLLTSDEQQHGFGTAVIYGLAAAAGFALVQVTLAALLQRLRFNDGPAALQGAGMTLLTMALMSLAFMGLA
jgi:electron transport complex protein RnfA